MLQWYVTDVVIEHHCVKTLLFWSRSSFYSQCLNQSSVRVWGLISPLLHPPAPEVDLSSCQESVSLSGRRPTKAAEQHSDQLRSVVFEHVAVLMQQNSSPLSHPQSIMPSVIMRQIPVDHQKPDKCFTGRLSLWSLLESRITTCWSGDVLNQVVLVDAAKH